MMTEAKAILLALKSIHRLKRGAPGTADLASYLYDPHPKLHAKLAELKRVSTKKASSPAARKAIGELLEQIAFLAFGGIKASLDVSSFRSIGPQYDLFVSSSDVAWLAICRMLGFSDNRRIVIVECKAWSSAIGDAEFGRLCSLVQHSANAGMGIFFSLRGASGFPQKGKVSASASAARLRQLIFFAHTRMPIVVLDLSDVLQLDGRGSFVKILSRKIDDISMASGAPLSRVKSPSPCKLPPHLQAL